jgi:hypothetical protein
MIRSHVHACSRRALLAAIVLATAVAPPLVSKAQTAVEFTGTWRLDKGASNVAAGAGLAGLGPGGTPLTLFIQQALNGSITIGSDMNEGQSRLYRMNGSSTLPAAKGDPIPVKSRVEGRTLLSEGSGLKESLTLSDDGQKLTVSVTAGEATSTLVYTKMTTVDPCTEWPTPCRS